MRVIKCAFTTAVVLSLAIASQPANAAKPSAPEHVSSKPVMSTVGSRIDSSNPIPAKKGGPPTGLPYRVLDKAIYAQAKADAARRAGQSQGPGSYARSDFSITATPSSQSVVQGSSTTYTVSTSVTVGAARPVSLTATGLPSGASATFNPASVTAGQNSTLTVSTTATAATGTFGFTITGQYSSPPSTHSTSVSLTVTAATDDFSISASPASRTLVAGSSTAFSVSTQVVSGTARTVTLSAPGLPSGASATFNPASVTAGQGSTLTIVTTTSATIGTSTLTITGQYATPSTIHSTTVSLTVTAAPSDDFSISASPSSQTVAQGSSTTFTVTTQVTSGAAQTVNLSVTGLPSGATGAFAPGSVVAGGASTLTVATATATPTGTFALTISGASATATHTAGVSLVVTAASTSGPTIGVTWNGQSEADLAPPDPTGAIGPNSYIQLINLRYGIYGRDASLIDEGDLGALTLFPVGELSDPQIVWDPTAQRYYYLAIDFYNSAYAFGYSKSADPRSSTDFCHYYVGGFYDSLYLPDYPKMAVTQDFVLVGTNVFLLAAFYNGSDVDWFQKPTDPVCPAQLGAGGIFSNLKNANGSQTSTPEPAVSADMTSGGWIVGSADVGTGSANYLTVFKVTKNAQGAAVISAPSAVTVGSYSMPANAPQNGTTQLLDTMDTRLPHAVAGYDPRIGATAIWTAHAVFGGAGAEDRWYEISTAGTPSLSQSGKASDVGLYVFNGAISPDRASDDSTDTSALTGRNMVMGFNTSSSTTFAAIRMVSQRGSGAQSGFVLVKQSVGPNVDFSCGSSLPDVCRWGDYGGATPDPLKSAGGEVWLSAEWNNPATDGSQPVWQTWNWSARP
jgi:hypothetical protein